MPTSSGDSRPGAPGDAMTGGPGSGAPGGARASDAAPPAALTIAGLAAGYGARPPGLQADVAACLPLCGVVALRCVAAIAPALGQRVLILGAPGGVGSFAVQLAARKGAHVIASGLPDDAEYLRALGAADVVGPGDGLIVEVRARYPDGVHGLIDLVDYRPAFTQHAGLLVPGGRAASVHRAVDEAPFADRGLHGTNVGSFPDRALLDQLGTLAVQGNLRVPITGRYPLDRAVAALADAKQKHSRGKRVIVLGGPADGTV